ncbi:MAG: hypothetical protein R6U11_00650 [Bacteroidales bacterium]
MAQENETKVWTTFDILLNKNKLLKNLKKDTNREEEFYDFIHKKFVPVEWLKEWLQNHKEHYGNLHVDDLLTELEE